MNTMLVVIAEVLAALVTLALTVAIVSNPAIL